MADIGPQHIEGEQHQSADPAALLLRVERLELLLANLTAELATLRSTPVAPTPVRKQHFNPSENLQPLSQTVQTTRSESLETQLGTRVLSKVGVVILLIGAAWFLKWAFDNSWIGPQGRILVGLLAGAGVVLWSERFRSRGFTGFSYALKAVGTGVLYLSLWAGFQLYHLMPGWVALLAMVTITAWNAFMAWLQDAQLLAGYALLGAYLTPILLSTGGDHEVFLFTYLFLFAAAVLALLYVKPWSRLLLGALPVTTVYFIAWYAEHFQASSSSLTLFFAMLLWAPFASVPLLAREPDGPIAGVLTPLGAASFGALAVYSVLADSNNKAFEPWAAVAFAAIYLLLMRVRRNGVASAVHLSLGIVFLTIAIPLKLTGRAITAGWLAEAVALLWVSTLPYIQQRAIAALRWLACASLLLGVAGALFAPLFNGQSQQALLNRNFATSLGAIAALVAAIVLSHKIKPDASRWDGRVIAASALILLNVVLLAAMYREIFLFFQPGNATNASTETADFASSGWMLLQGAALMVAGFWRRSALPRWLGLLLLAATVIKAFAYDLRNLGTGYRVISYLGLGIVLMAVSFAYQNNWLGLKETADSHENDHQTTEAAR